MNLAFGVATGITHAGAVIVEQIGVRTEDIDNLAFIERGQGRFSRILELQVPVICALKGWVIGGSFERSLVADLRIAAEGTRFMLPEVKHGVITDTGGTTYDIGFAEGTGLFKFNTDNPDDAVLTVLVINDQSPTGVISLKENGIEGLEDLPGKKVSATQNEATVLAWRAMGMTFCALCATQGSAALLTSRLAQSMEGRDR